MPNQELAGHGRSALLKGPLRDVTCTSVLSVGEGASVEAVRLYQSDRFLKVSSAGGPEIAWMILSNRFHEEDLRTESRLKAQSVVVLFNCNPVI